jgi:signal transduction histidine kinase
MSLLLITALSVLIPEVAACGKTDSRVSIEESNNRVAQATTHVAAAGLGAMLENITDETRRVEAIRNFIEPIRFFADHSGYFYVYDYNCVNIAHAVDKTLVGQDLTNYMDSNGKFVIRELSAAAKTGGGFVTFYWPHPVTKEVMRKIGYVEPIPGTGYFIGTGYYPDTQ